MKIFAIADLHFSFKKRVIPGKWDEIEEYKSMKLFGEKWSKHYQKIYEKWINIVSEQDFVLIPGDISWASTLKEFEIDLDFIKHLPGNKVFIKGNHDYWWPGINKLRSILPNNIYVIQNDSLNIKGVNITGTRGWITPNSYQFSEQDKRIYLRELIRLEMSLKSIKKDGRVSIVMFHYMPTNEEHVKNEVIDLLLKHNVDVCIYGHLHGEESHQIKLPEEKWGIKFQLVSSDYLDFCPKLIYKL